jgi:hypothetical protein
LRRGVEEYAAERHETEDVCGDLRCCVCGSGIGCPCCESDEAYRVSVPEGLTKLHALLGRQPFVEHHEPCEDCGANLDLTDRPMVWLRADHIRCESCEAKR